MELGLVGALVGGVLTLLSPCSVMLLPAFFSYAFDRPSVLVARTGVFYLGLITTLVPLGVLAGTVGAFVTQNRVVLVTAAAVIVIILGAVMLLGVPVPSFSRGSASEGTNTAAVYVLGTVYGLAGVCAGPLLGAVLTLAALGENAFYGGMVLLVFAAGMVLPLLLLALVWARLPVVRRILRPRELRVGRWRNAWASVVGGAVTISLGIFLIATEGTSSLAGVLGASEQARLEDWARTTTSSIPDWVVLVAALLAAALARTASLLARRAAAPSRLTQSESTLDVSHVHRDDP